MSLSTAALWSLAALASPLPNASLSDVAPSAAAQANGLIPMASADLSSQKRLQAKVIPQRMAAIALPSPPEAFSPIERPSEIGPAPYNDAPLAAHPIDASPVLVGHLDQLEDAWISAYSSAATVELAAAVGL